MATISPTASGSVPTNTSTNNANNNNNNNNNSTNSMIPLTTIQVGSALPLIRSRTAPQGQQQQQQLQEQPPQRERSNTADRPFVGSSTDTNDWQQQWQQPQQQPQSRQNTTNDPDSQEQALFEQRLCEDIYGVAVRKINHNGKSNLRYVKCSWVDISEVYGDNDHSKSNNNNHHHLQYSSSRSVSSRQSKGSTNGLSRFLGGVGHHSAADDAHKSLLLNNESSSRRNMVRVLTWGKKKDVTVPLDQFTFVRKGKVNDRTRKNPCEAARIVSLVTDCEGHQKHAVSLDIEAPTRLDRDKFARAFARFLNVPLIEEGESWAKGSSTTTGFAYQSHYPTLQQQQQSLTFHMDGSRSITRSIKSDATAQSSWKGVPDTAPAGTTNSIATNGNSVRSTSNSIKRASQHAPLPVVTTRHLAAANTKPPRNMMIRKSTPPPIHPGAPTKQQIISRGSDVDDPPLASLHTSSTTRSRGDASSTSKNRNTIHNNTATALASPTTKNRKMVLEIPMVTKSRLLSTTKNSSSTPQNPTPATSATAGHASTTPESQAPEQADKNDTTNNDDDDDDDDASVVSSITSVGFDQDLVEELHLALEKMKVELEESRAEASRAVKVAEQAIQSAENSNSKDWNNTVTHKAAEAAATAQKKSAEAMAKARIAEERLEMERKNGALAMKQVEEAKELAAHWQTRAAAAEVQRHAFAYALESERTITKELSQQQQQQSPTTDDSSSNNLACTTSEVVRLRSKLAIESARRKKLLDELQDLRGAIRVYCRLKEPAEGRSTGKSEVLEVISNEVLMLHRNPSQQQQHQQNVVLKNNVSTTMNFEFDGILSSDTSQQDVYAELEAICSSVVEGFKICFMTYGQADSGKTHTMLGDIATKDGKDVSIDNHGVHLRAMEQLFSLLKHQKDQFQNTVTMTLVEVHDERLTDLLAGTNFGEEHGKVEGSRRSSRRQQQQQDLVATNSISSGRPKLEIKTNRDGETILCGVLSVEVSSYGDVLRVWTESLARRSRRLVEQDVKDPRAYELASHVVATLKVVSKNVSTGAIATGRMQFVDLASCEVVTKQSANQTSSSICVHKRSPSSGSSCSPNDWKFTNKSLNTFREVILARNQYQRSVPYRNSTITHILSDSLEADTKVVVMACVSADEATVSDTACLLQFAQEMRNVIIGKATRHTTIATAGNNNKA